MDSRIKFYKAAYSGKGKVFDIVSILFSVQENIQVPRWPRFRRCSSRHSAIQLKGDAIFKPVAMKGIKTIIKAGSKAIKEGSTVNDVITSSLKPTVGAVLGATVDQFAPKLIEMRNNQNDAPPPNPPIMFPVLN